MLSIIVIEGAGDAAERLYEPALRKFKAEKGDLLSVIITDVSCLWKDKPSVYQKRMATITQFKSWGAQYLDKSFPFDGSNREDYEKYEQLKNKEVDVIFVATDDAHHAEVADYWIDSKCKQIFIEKPLERQYTAAMRLAGKLRPDDSRVLVFDHYRAKVHDELRDQVHIQSAILDHLGGSIRRFSFYFLEDHSGTDTKYSVDLQKKCRPQRHGPIENEDRVGAVKPGLIFDMMPHMPALLCYFGLHQTIRPFRVKAGIYTGVDFKGDEPTEIEGETFAAVEFQFIEVNEGNRINGEAYIGKGIRGSTQFKEWNGDIKALLLEGNNGKKMIFDLRGGGTATATLVSKSGKTKDVALRLQRDPYYYLLQSIDKEEDKAISLGLPLVTGVEILEVMQKMRFSLEGRKKENYPIYSLGPKDGHAPYLEEILEALPLLYGV